MSILYTVITNCCGPTAHNDNLLDLVSLEHLMEGTFYFTVKHNKKNTVLKCKLSITS